MTALQFDNFSVPPSGTNTATFATLTPDAYRSPEYGTTNLLDRAAYYEDEFYRFERAQRLADPSTGEPGDLPFIEETLRAVLPELSRRRRLAERFRFDPLGPRWPSGGEQQRSNLVQLAHALKEQWPIDSFMTELMGVELTASGPRRWKCRCPMRIHRDRNPSMVVYGDPGDEHVHCFTCGFHGDHYHVIGSYFGLTEFRDVVKKLAEATVPAQKAVQR